MKIAQGKTGWECSIDFSCTEFCIHYIGVSEPLGLRKLGFVSRETDIPFL